MPEYLNWLQCYLFIGAALAMFGLRLAQHDAEEGDPYAAKVLELVRAHSVALPAVVLFLWPWLLVSMLLDGDDNA